MDIKLNVIEYSEWLLPLHPASWGFDTSNLLFFSNKKKKTHHKGSLCVVDNTPVMSVVKRIHSLCPRNVASHPLRGRAYVCLCVLICASSTSYLGTPQDGCIQFGGISSVPPFSQHPRSGQWPGTLHHQLGMAVSHCSRPIRTIAMTWHGAIVALHGEISGGRNGLVRAKW